MRIVPATRTHLAGFRHVLLLTVACLPSCRQTPTPAGSSPAPEAPPGEVVSVNSAPTAMPVSHPPTAAAASAPAPAPARPSPRKPVAAKTSPAVASGALATKPPAAAAPALDLAALEQRLRDTKAIGVFTKLSLKNQVDDLLDNVRAYYRSPSPAAQPALRQQFDGLMLKVLSSLQDGDPQLATAIAASREALWGILMDPDKFSKI